MPCLYQTGRKGYSLMLDKLFGRKGHLETHDATNEPPNSKPKHRNRAPTLKQKKFVEGVIQHGNASKAARDAGYSERSARVLACRNLKRPDIQAQIKSRIESAEIDTNEIIGTLVGHMRADIANLLADDGSLDLAGAIENGSTQMIKKLIIRKRPIKGITDERGDPIEETTYDIVIHDSQLAAWRLARILHLEVNNRPPEARRPTDDELAPQDSRPPGASPRQGKTGSDHPTARANPGSPVRERQYRER
jgi:hypothetical protein